MNHRHTIPQNEEREESKERLTKCVGYHGSTPIFVLNKSELRGRPSLATVTALSDRLGLYEEAEEQGRLLIGKYPLDTEVWAVDDKIIRGVVHGYTHRGEPMSLICMCESAYDWGWYYDRCIFDNEEDAQAALEAQGGGDPV